MRIDADFAEPDLVRGLAKRIASLSSRTGPRTLMEVCGTHTQAIGRWGLRSLLPESVRLVSGPGCPVCVTPGGYIDQACGLAAENGVTLATFGDLVRVPGNEHSLEEVRSAGADVRIVYSPADAIALAKELAPREVVFLAVGFETTIAGIAAAIKSAHLADLENLSFFCSLRLVPPALQALLADPEVAIDGFLLPGHVSVITGLAAYSCLEEAGVPGAVAGFEPVDILQGVAMLLEMLAADAPAVRNLYGRAVRPDGNPMARTLIGELFEPAEAVWRGIGSLPDSGLRLQPTYAHLDAARRHGLSPLEDRMPAGCACGRVLRGAILPRACPLFGKACTPDHPVGPCMVSGEGSCAAHYRYAD